MPVLWNHYWVPFFNVQFVQIANTTNLFESQFVFSCYLSTLYAVFYLAVEMFPSRPCAPCQPPCIEKI